MGTFSAEVHGLDAVKRLFADIGKELSAAELRGVLDDAGRVVISQAKSEIPFTGEIGQAFKKDLGVYRDRGNKNAEYVLAGPRFKPYTIHGKDQKVAVIAQHMTEGFSQSDRKGHGRVKDQKINPVLDAYKKTKSEQNAGINKGIQKKIRKIKNKYPELVR